MAVDTGLTYVFFISLFAYFDVYGVLMSGFPRAGCQVERLGCFRSAAFGVGHIYVDGAFVLRDEEHPFAGQQLRSGRRCDVTVGECVVGRIAQFVPTIVVVVIFAGFFDVFEHDAPHDIAGARFLLIDVEPHGGAGVVEEERHLAGIVVV